MKKIYFLAFLFLCTFLTIGTNTAWGETKQGSWDLTKTSADWTATRNETYFSQPYGFKKDDGTLTNKSIADFSISGITQIKVGFKCLQNGGSTSKITIWLVDKDGKSLGEGIVVTPINKSQATQTTYQYATFTTNLSNATGFMMKVTTFGKNILVNGAEYTVTYTTAPLPKHTITWSTPDGTSTTQEVTQGNAIGTLPVPEPASCSSTYTNFVGWFTEAAGSESNPSTAKPATQVTAATVPTGDATYYAVFSDGSEGNNWELVTDASTLAIGDNITFASSKTLSSTTYVIKAFADDNNWPAGQYDTTEPQTFTLQAGKVTGSWAFFDGTGYPYAANSSGSKNNHMKRQTTLTDAGSFTITISDSNTPSATIIAQTSSANGYVNLRYNSSSHLFSCYKTAQSAPYIYRKVSSATGYISSCCNDPAVVTVTPATTTINLGEDGKATTTVTCTQQNGGTAGTWSYSVSPSTATFDGTNFVATAAGEYTLTATYTENCGKSGTATINVTNTPVLYFPTPTPADPIKFGIVECGGNTPLTDKQTISLRGYNLTGDVIVTVTGDYKIADTESTALADYATSITLPKDAVSGLSKSVYVISTPPMQSSSSTTGKVTFATAGGNTLEVNLSTPDITCTEYTLTLKDRGTTISEENYLAGASVPKPADLLRY